jgi:transcriptional regulator with XRE-family HTH domain
MQADYHERYATFRGRLQQARLDAGLTQAEIAARLGKPRSFVSKCESGERRVDVVELTRFAPIYGKPLEFFLPQGEP